MSIKCHLCACRVSTEEDMKHHLIAHKMYGKKLPSLGEGNKIDDLVNRYDEYLQEHTRSGEKQSFRDSKLGEQVFDYNCTSYRELVIKKMQNNPRCEVCNRRKPAECHHVIPVMTAPQLSLVNSNIIAICKPCHKKVHEEYNTSRQTYEDNNSVWVDYSEETVHCCIQCGASFYGPLYRNYCKTCYHHNKSDYY